MTLDAMDPIIYVVDDDSDVRKSMDSVFLDAGLKSQGFDSAEEFLKHADPKRHGCLVLDVRLAGLTGMELLERLAEQRSDLPVIMVSAHGHISMSVEAVKLGAVNFFEKPYQPSALVAAVKEAVQMSAERMAVRARLAEIESLLEPLNPSERRVLDGLVAGQGHNEIAAQLGLSLRSIEYRKASLAQKMGLSSRADLVAIMREHDELLAKCQGTHKSQ